jgi:hypothetical protein
MINHEGLEALQHILDYGIKVIGAYESGAAIASGEDYARAYTNDIDEIKALIAGNGDRQGRAKGTPIMRFRFTPAAHSLLCLDIDNHKAGVDGIADLYRLFESWGKLRTDLPLALRSLPTSFPCYVQSPNGYHFYFKYHGRKPERKLLTPKYSNIEIKHGPPGLTTPGSFKDGRPYVLHGNLDVAPELYGFLANKLSRSDEKPMKMFVPLNHEPRKWITSWEQIIEWTDKDGYGEGGRNNWAYSVARHAVNHGWSKFDTLEALRTEPRIEGLPDTEIINAVESAYKRNT